MYQNMFWLPEKLIPNLGSDHLQLHVQKIGKQMQDILVECFPSGHILYHKIDMSIRCIQLSFDYKYQITRLCQNFSQDKNYIGEIISICIIKYGSDKTLEITGQPNQMLQLSQFLSQHINKLGFQQYFRIEKIIKVGNQVRVYRAQRLEDGLWVAVKQFNKLITYSQDLGKEKLINEINIMRKLDHPNLMKLYEVCETDNSIQWCYRQLCLSLGKFKTQTYLIFQFKNDQLLPKLFSYFIICCKDPKKCGTKNLFQVILIFSTQNFWSKSQYF